ncbi:MAG: ABC transporter substrate-binding protein [Candidatus Methanomethyliaceae archaeon]
MKKLFVMLSMMLVFSGVAHSEKVVLQYWDITTHPSKEWWRSAMIEAFNKLYPDIEVQLFVVPFDEYFQKLQVAFAAGTAPDVFAVDCPMVPRYVVVDDVLLPLDEYFKYEMADFLEASMAEATWDGHFYAVPMFQSSQALFYNKRMFAELGLQPPTDPEDAWTWEQVVEVAKKLTKDLDGDGTPDIWGLLIEQIDRPYQLNPLLESKGAQLIAPDGSTVNGYLNSPAAVEAMTFYWKLFNEWRITPRQPMLELFGEGKAAMVLGGPWNIARWKLYPDLEWGVMPHPYFEGGRKVTPCGSWHLGIYKYSKHVKEAVQFIAFMTDYSGTDLNYIITAYLPVRKSTYILHDLFDQYPINVFAKQLFTSASPRPRLPAYLEFEDILRRAYQNVMAGGDPASELNAAVTQIDRILARYRR